MSLHRQIWEKEIGEIPVDEYGVTYEIHHIDGNNKNNDISNLKCVSLQEHFDIHYSQGDWFACKLIMLKLSIPDNLRSEILKKAGQKTAKKLKGRKHSKETKTKISNSLRIVKLGHVVSNETRKKISKANSKPNPKVGDALRGKKKSNESIEKRKRTLANQPLRTCPHCRITGKGSNMTRYHFDNCKLFQLGDR